MRSGDAMRCILQSIALCIVGTGCVFAQTAEERLDVLEVGAANTTAGLQAISQQQAELESQLVELKERVPEDGPCCEDGSANAALALVLAISALILAAAAVIWKRDALSELPGIKQQIDGLPTSDLKAVSDLRQSLDAQIARLEGGLKEVDARLSKMNAVDRMPPYAPQLQAVTPDRGVPGHTEVELTGSQFSLGGKVYFGGEEAATVRSRTRNRIVVEAPQGSPGLVEVRVVNSDGLAVPIPMQFTYLPPLRLTGGTIDVKSNEQVRLEGDGFATRIELLLGDDVLEAQAPKATELTFTAPQRPDGTTVKAKVRNVDGGAVSAEEVELRWK